MTPALMLLATLTSPGPSTVAVPPPAAQAGYTTLAFRSDFTAPIRGRMESWLDCAGALRPQWWITGFAASAPPCDRVAIVDDGGAQALSLKFTAADVANRALALNSMNAYPGSYDQGIDFPNGVYYQITMRVTPQSIDGNRYGALVAALWTWSDTAALGLSPSWSEWDIFEAYANGGKRPTGHDYDDSAASMYNPREYSLVVDGCYAAGVCYYYPIDQTQYFTVGFLVTQDGAKNISICNYLNGALQRCDDAISAGITINASRFDQRNYLILQAGTEADGIPVQADMEMLVRDVEVWTCAGWRGPIGVPGHACNTGLIQ